MDREGRRNIYNNSYDYNDNDKDNNNGSVNYVKDKYYGYNDNDNNNNKNILIETRDVAFRWVSALKRLPPHPHPISSPQS